MVSNGEEHYLVAFDFKEYHETSYMRPPLACKVVLQRFVVLRVVYYFIEFGLCPFEELGIFLLQLFKFLANFF